MQLRRHIESKSQLVIGTNDDFIFVLINVREGVVHHVPVETADNIVNLPQLWGILRESTSSDVVPTAELQHHRAH
jgi:hypothetical protein